MCKVIYLISWFVMLGTACAEDLDERSRSLIKEHVLGALPSSEQLIIRTAFIADYWAEKKTPRWVAYHLNDNYVRIPKQTGAWKGFRGDSRVEGELNDADFVGTYHDPIGNYIAGHLVPFFAAGGDRNGDGKVLDANQNGAIDEGEDDVREEGTVFEVNSYTNAAPQAYHSFAGPSGIWTAVEKRILALQKSKKDLWVVAGPIFGPGTYDKLPSGVPVAPMFFQVIAWYENGHLKWDAYLLPHHQLAHGDPSAFLVSLRHIEALSGLDFFAGLTLGESERLSTHPAE